MSFSRFFQRYFMAQIPAQSFHLQQAAPLRNSIFVTDLHSLYFLFTFEIFLLCLLLFVLP